jgi:chromate reductase
MRSDRLSCLAEGKVMQGADAFVIPTVQDQPQGCQPLSPPRRDHPVLQLPAMPDLLVITASNGENLRLAERFAAAAEQRGHRAALLDLSSLDLPLFRPQARDAGIPTALPALEQQLAATPAWVICAPEYNGSIPPVLTSAIAWLSVQGRDFRALFNARPIALATHSGGGGTMVLAALRLQLAHLGALVVGRQLVSNNTKPALDETIADLVDRVISLRPPTPPA